MLKGLNQRSAWSMTQCLKKSYLLINRSDFSESQKIGYLINHKYRKDIIIPLMSSNDNELYALLTTIRRRPSLQWKEKIGKTHYFAMHSENLIQVAIPISDWLFDAYIVWREDLQLWYGHNEKDIACDTATCVSRSKWCMRVYADL